MIDKEQWRLRAACRGADTNIFYPEVGGNEAAAQARAICAQCRVQSECLEYALEHYDREGIWGGMSERERRNFARRRRREERQR